MMAAGALEEVRILRALNLNPELTAMKAVGVRELSGLPGWRDESERRRRCRQAVDPQLCEKATHLA